MDFSCITDITLILIPFVFMDSWTTRGKTVPRVRRQVVDLDVCTAAQPDILAGALARKGSSSCVLSVDNKPFKYGRYIYTVLCVYYIIYIYTSVTSYIPYKAQLTYSNYKPTS
jgi:hypothetical protein